MSAVTVVFFGYGPLAVAGIDALASSSRLAAVVVPSNRSGGDVDLVARRGAALGVPILSQPPRAELAPFLDRLRNVAPDVIVVWSYSMLLPREVIELPPLGTVNVHTGLLPEYRGGHVLQWALLNGEPETGVTLHYMDAAIDTGPVIAQTRFPIAEDDDAVGVKEKLKEVGSDLLRQWWPRIADGTAPRTPQDESRARHWPLRRPEEGRIDWTRRAADVCRLVRALNANSPGAFTDVGETRVSITRAVPASRGDSLPGLRLAAGDGDVIVTEASIDGRVLTGIELQNLRDLVSHYQPGR